MNKVNMLVVLDTSGSMTGLPGDTFSSVTEAGVDCDNGEDCRGWGTPGGCVPGVNQCQPMQGLGCPAGFMPDMTDLKVGGASRNKVKNHDFKVGGGPSGNAWNPAANFTPDVPNAGDNKYPYDTSCAVRNVGMSINGTLPDIEDACWPTKTPFDPPKNCVVRQTWFKGDPCMYMPPTAGFLYCNGNSLNRDYRPWQQNVTNLTAGKTYAVWAYISNAINPKINWSPGTLPMWKFKRDGVDLPTGLPNNGPWVLKNERDRTDAWRGQDAWERFQTTFTASAASHVLSLWDSSRGGGGDDTVITQINVRECVPIENGVCSVTKDQCGSGKPCASTVNLCSGDGTACTTPGAICEKDGLCEGSTNPLVWCKDEFDCPQWGDKGKCAATGDPCNGPCPSVKKCSVSGDACSDTVKCKKNKTKGYCEKDATKTCKNNKACGSAGKCIFPPNQCAGQSNECKHPHRPCLKPKNTDPENKCQSLGNVCQLPAPVPPKCLLDRPDKIMMCQQTMTKCKVTSDCKAGDVCGAPTSRAVVAKRVLKNTIEETKDMVNAGFMTFYQDGYFPYFTGANVLGGNTKLTQYLTREQLVTMGCYDGISKPISPCGQYSTLRASGGIRYFSAYTNTFTDQDFCGDACPMKPGARTGILQGAYYEYFSTVFDGANTARVNSSTYQGRIANINGEQRIYYTPNAEYYNNGEKPTAVGFKFTNCASACSAECGGRWNPSTAPFLDVTGVNSEANATAIAARLEKAKNGGVITFGGTPSGCTLLNDASALAADKKPEASAYHYMERVLNELQSKVGLTKAESMTCRPNFVLFVTDGEANGPGDQLPPAKKYDRPQAICATDARCDVSVSNPVSAGCPCRAINAAYKMRTELGVKTLVVGFGGDVTQGNGRIINERLAKHGGTDSGDDGIAPYAYAATNEEDLREAVTDAISYAARGSYSTAPPSASAGVQQTNQVEIGKRVLDTRVDFPSWKGHLLSWDVSGEQPVLEWDAANLLDQRNYWERMVYVGTSSGPVRIQANSNGTVTNAATLHGLGLGASVEEAGLIVRWLLGDDTMNNPAVLGPILNSVPIDVGQPGNSPFPGGKQFFEKYKDRPSIIYVGSGTGMLHAFMSKDTTVGSTTYPGGTELFAYIPRENLRNITKLFAQGRQSQDPTRHIYGVSNSPKVKSMCVSNCADPKLAVWKTLLVIPNGFGGNVTSMLDITEPFATNGIADPPFKIQWHTSDTFTSQKYNESFGLTVSLPAFTFNKTDARDDFRLISGSGYGVNPAIPGQGKSIVVSSAKTGAVIESYKIPEPLATCSQEYTALTDVATARDHYRGQTSSDDSMLRMLGAYVGDTWGRLHRLGGNGILTTRAEFGCQHPLHFAPAVVQLDRDLPDNRRGQIYITQVTNSHLDDDTLKFSPSNMVIMKDAADKNGVVTSDVNFGTAGRITIPSTSICSIMSPDTTGCGGKLPANSRPTMTPMAILKNSGSGFKLFSVWYVPSTTGCSRGSSYLTIFDVNNDVVEQTHGLFLANDAIVGMVFAGGKILVSGSNGLVRLDGLIKGLNVVDNSQLPMQYKGLQFNIGSWTEVE